MKLKVQLNTTPTYSSDAAWWESERWRNGRRFDLMEIRLGECESIMGTLTGEVRKAAARRLKSSSAGSNPALSAK